MKVFCILLLIALGTVLQACSDSSPTLKMAVNSAQYLNPNVNGSAAPVVLEVYQLKTPYTFTQASFSELSNNPAALLGNDLIDKQSYELRPGQQQNLQETLSNDTHYLGIIADYRNIDHANWRSVIELPRDKSEYQLAINLQSQGIATKLNN